MNPRPLFSVPVHDLDISGKDLRAKIPGAWLDSVLAESHLRHIGEGELDVHLSQTGQEVLVRGTIRVTLEVECARCLAPVRLGDEFELTLLLRPSTKPRRATGSAARPIPHRERMPKKAERKSRRSRPAEEEYEFTSEEADMDVYEGDEIVLDGFVREALLLEEPISPLCSDACEGIRPPADSSPQAYEDGADTIQASDPRLSRIAELISQKKTKKKE